MAVYMIVETKITDKEVFSRYGEKIDEVLKNYLGIEWDKVTDDEVKKLCEKYGVKAIILLVYPF